MISTFRNIYSFYFLRIHRQIKFDHSCRITKSEEQYKQDFELIIITNTLTLLGA